MKWLIVAAFLAVASVSVRADEELLIQIGGYILDIVFEDTPCGSCACVQPSRWNPRGGTCYGVNGTVDRGCPNTNSFIQCMNTNCTVLNCSTGQVWNQTAKACAACPAGQHVRADNQTCVCNQGTTFNRTSNACSPCPTGATLQADRCFCPNTTVFDRSSYSCRACPAGSTMVLGQCICKKATPTMYWNHAAWACQPCPGTVQNVTSGWGFFKTTTEICNCTGADQIFDVREVSCFTCPAATTTRDRDGDECDCNLRLQEFNMKTKMCECVSGYALNAAGTACVYSPPTKSTAASAGAGVTSAAPAATAAGAGAAATTASSNKLNP